MIKGKVYKTMIMHGRCHGVSTKGYSMAGADLWCGSIVVKKERRILLEKTEVRMLDGWGHAEGRRIIKEVRISVMNYGMNQ